MANEYTLVLYMPSWWVGEVIAFVKQETPESPTRVGHVYAVHAEGAVVELPCCSPLWGPTADDDDLGTIRRIVVRG
jgi:hypothetical protein